MALLWSCSDVEPVSKVDNFVVQETEADGNMELQLTWTVNGVRDDGMVTDLNIYLAQSFDIDNMERNPAFQSIRKSSMNFPGGARMIPTTRDLFDARRYYIGVAFNGVLPTGVTYPIAIDYQLTITQPNVEGPIRVIPGQFLIESGADATKTFVHYSHTLDIADSAPDAPYLKYFIRALAQPVHEMRESDVTITNTFDSRSYLYIDFYWKTAAGDHGYEPIDLDLYLHDITKTNVEDFSDMEESSANEDKYERIATDTTHFISNKTRKLGYYFFDNMSDETATVQYMYKVYTLTGSKIRRFTQFGSFSTPPITEHNGSFYFTADVVWNKNTKEFKITPLASPLKWTP
jgi:hypothetical protein